MALAFGISIPADWLVWAKTNPASALFPPLSESPVSESIAQQSRFAGAKACAACHTEIAEKHQQAVMTKAMEKADSCQILREFPDLKFKSGKFSFQIARQGEKSLYIIGDGKSELSLPILYCFGQGKAGQTYVFENNGAMYESRVSFYREINGLDITLGYAGESPQTLTEAAGRQMSLDETKRCFGCHTTGSTASVSAGSPSSLTHLAPGVGCESCHGPGDNHIALMKAGDQAAAKTKIKKLGNLDGDDITQSMCGSCHRSV